MPDYKRLYLTMFHAAEEALTLLEGCCGDMERIQKAFNILVDAQQQCEDIYVGCEE